MRGEKRLEWLADADALEPQPRFSGLGRVSKRQPAQLRGRNLIDGKQGPGGPGSSDAARSRAIHPHAQQRRRGERPCTRQTCLCLSLAVCPAVGAPQFLSCARAKGWLPSNALHSFDSSHAPIIYLLAHLAVAVERGAMPVLTASSPPPLSHLRRSWFMVSWSL